MDRPRLLLVPNFTELEWGITEHLGQWAEFASFDMPGVGDTPIPDSLRDASAADLPRWRSLGVEQALSELERRGWDTFYVVADSFAHPTAVRVCSERRDGVLGLALGHASLSHSTTGERAPLRKPVWDAMTQVARQGGPEFVRHALTQITRGAVTEELAAQMAERFPDPQFVTTVFEAFATLPEPIGGELERLDVPLLFAKHEGCVGHTDEGFEDIVKAFPGARTVICPEQCASSPAFAEALRDFCGD